jgi:hypothetical protein
VRPALVVADDFLPFPESIRKQALELPYLEREFAGERYRGVAELPHFGPWELLANAVGYNVEPTMSFFRRGEPGDHPTVWIHADRAAGSAAAVLYFDHVGGTAFWRHRSTGWEELPPADQLGEEPEKVCAELNRQGADAAAWEMTGYVAAKPNRLITYPADVFHSRWPLELRTRRHIWVAFFNLL